MSWVDDSAVIVAAMTNLGYRRIENNLNMDQKPSSRNSKSYTMTLGVPDTTYMTNNKQVQTDHVIIEIAYKQMSLADYDANYVLFKAVNTALKNLAGYVSLINFDYPSSPNTSKEVRAIIEFYYGVMTC